MSANKKKMWKKKIVGTVVMLGGLYAVMKMVAKKRSDDNDIDTDNPYLKGSDRDKNNDGVSPESFGGTEIGIYENKIKPIFDSILSFGGLVLLSPVYAVVAALIYVDDPGPIFFSQKRVGKDGHFFMLHKFRSMKMSTPHDVPTHMLEKPEQYITRVGKVLRKTSLDELPQIWDIFRGKMSVIGPRPALWNQEDLIAEREKYGANGVIPGLTGWAQINGRDELEIEEKARLDGEYVQALKNGGITALSKDIKCFLRTIINVLKSDGVVEGGTGKVDNPNNGLLDRDTNPDHPKRILITGAESYIGEAVKEYLGEAGQDFYDVTIFDTIGLKPERHMFEGYDVVFNVAGIAHVKETETNRHLYYEVNRDLAIELARAAKEAGVGQFILLSSMSVYGMTTGQIKKEDVPYPTTAYGESKLAADEAVENLRDENFHVAILRPPMVYGKGCKGNYQLLRKFALRSPVFPEYRNKRSMLFIGNLCEFVKRVIDSESSGIFFPQNKEYMRTSEMVRLVAKENGKTIVTTSAFNLLIKVLHFNILQKIFGNLIYENVDTIGKFNLGESIHLTEMK